MARFALDFITSLKTTIRRNRTQANIDVALKSYQAFGVESEYKVVIVIVSDIKTYPNYYLDDKQCSTCLIK